MINRRRFLRTGVADSRPTQNTSVHEWSLSTVASSCHSFFNSIKLNEANGIIEVDRLNSDDWVLLIKLKVDSSILSITICDIYNITKEFADIVVCKELVVLFILIITILIQTVIIKF